MGRSPYQSEKRRKELARLEKQKEKRERRFNKKHAQPVADGQAAADGQPATGEPGEPLQPAPTDAADTGAVGGAEGQPVAEARGTTMQPEDPQAGGPQASDADKPQNL